MCTVAFVAQRARTSASSSRTRRLRRAVLGVALAATAVKLYLAATTAGTNDVYSFQFFAHAVSKFGVIGIYGQKVVDGAHGHALYNHPPLVGWMLLGLNRLTELGMSFRFLIRLPATFADVVTALLVFELVRSRRSLGEAGIAGVMVAGSPALIVVSGFHGNTDPVFVMFAILSLYLLVIRRSGVLAGMSFAAAISIKILPIAALPVLLLIAARAGRRRFLEFCAGGGALMALLWLPVVVEGKWPSFSQNVIGYKGVPGKWGLVEIATKLHLSPHTIHLLVGPGRFPLLLVSAGVPLFVAWRRPSASIPAFGLAMVLVWLLSTASSGGRYLVWAVAAAFLVDVASAAAYDIAASVLMVEAYNRYNGGFPWNRAQLTPWTHIETLMAAIAWFALLAVVIMGVMQLRRPAEPAGGGDSPGPVETSDDEATDAAGVPLFTSDVN